MKIMGTVERPRLSVFRSHRHLWVQLIDDTSGVTLAAASDRDVKEKKQSSARDRAGMLGALIAARAAEKNIMKVVFDRGGYAYHGGIRALAEGARKGGLQF